jgi:pimeloyl-ACP methyl ester carboxylesterase
VEREIEDLAALIEAAGSSASLCGHSSGAGLVLHAAAHGLPVDLLVLHEPPYGPGGEEDMRSAREYARACASLEAEEHVVAPERLAPVLAEFLAGG